MELSGNEFIELNDANTQITVDKKKRSKVTNEIVVLFFAYRMKNECAIGPMGIRMHRKCACNWVIFQIEWYNWVGNLQIELCTNDFRSLSLSLYLSLFPFFSLFLSFTFQLLLLRDDSLFTLAETTVDIVNILQFVFI